MAASRDPLSVRYDNAVRAILIRAARASRSRHGVIAWVASPRHEYRRRDVGGRTTHERAFTRSAYYQVWREPINRGLIPDWSLKLEWGADGDRRASAEGRLARPVRVRLYVRSSGLAHRRGAGPGWADDPARQSKIDGGGVRIIGG